MKNQRLGSVLGALLLGCLVSQLTAAVAPSSSKLDEAIRSGATAQVRSLVKSRNDANTLDEAGNTPLMSAALNADAAMVEVLLKAGADVNAANKSGATALMRAATFPDKAKLLVAAGADVKARSRLGNTPLLMAARQHGNSRTVKLLLDRGAEINTANVFGATPLMAAVAAEDQETVRLLLDRGADVNAKPNMNPDGVIWGGGRTPLMWAAFRNNEALAKLLLARGAKVDEFTVVGSALTMAAWGGHPGMAKLLLAAGARVDQPDFIANYTPLHWAASSEKSDPRLVELLLSHKAEVNAEGGQPVDNFVGVVQTPLMLARKRGETPIVQALLKAGAREASAAAVKRPGVPARRSIDRAEASLMAEAIQLAVPRLQTSAIESQATFLRHASKQDCISCHQQQLPTAAISLARSRRIAVDETEARKQVQGVERFGVLLHDLDLEAVFHPEAAIGNGYALLALHLEKRPPSPFTDSQVHQLAVTQGEDGHWAWNLPRPPIQSSDITSTALAVQALKNYPIPGRQREFDERIQRARAWLAKSAPESNEERAYQLLGLAWAGERAGKLRPLAETLVREQRADGGWGQLAKLPSDAYATGLTLYALLQGGGLPASHPAVQNGVRHLLLTQLEDGTWHVRRRAHPFQPPMESGFPHGADGWISASGTSWAVMALASALDPAQVPGSAGSLAGSPKPAAHSATDSGAAKLDSPVEFARDIKPLLERSCAACHSGERPKGGFQVTARQAFLHGGARGEPVVVPGKSDASPLLRIVQDKVEDMEMPPVGRRDKFPALTKDESAKLRAWIDQGAAWPAGATVQVPTR